MYKNKKKVIQTNNSYDNDERHKQMIRRYKYKDNHKEDKPTINNKNIITLYRRRKIGGYNTETKKKNINTIIVTLIYVYTHTIANKREEMFNVTFGCSKVIGM